MDQLVRLVEHIPAYVLIPLGLTAASLVVLLVIRSFREGREISFWPPRIGPRPEAKTSGAQAVVQNAQVASAHRPSLEPPPGLAPRDELRPRKQEIIFDQVDLDRLKVGEVIGRTEHSLIQKCVYDGKVMVVKRTRADLCDLEALRLLMHSATDPLGGWSESVRSRVGAPRVAWTKDGYLWELQDYYEGMSLGNLVLRNHQSLNGEFLKVCSNSLAQVLFALGRMGLIHRDINPFNLFLTYSGDLILIDWTFCTRESIQLRSVVTAGYTAPEQEQGTSCHASDWYSFAATLFFLSNCAAPPQRRSTEYTSGISRMYTGGHKLHYRQAESDWGSLLGCLCDGLMAPEVGDRQIPSAIEWEPVTLAGGRFPSPRAFDFGSSNHLVVTDAEFWILPTHLGELSGVLAGLDEREAGSRGAELFKRVVSLYGQTPA